MSKEQILASADATQDKRVIGYKQADGILPTLFTRTWDDFFGDVQKKRFTRYGGTEVASD